ncbi:MAG TPA: inorganic pyrophosphatase [Thermodesulfobacteriota bacterium]|nr:inorganic pyrophosphatase [Thermodesulfobacteriota bacterium]
MNSPSRYYRWRPHPWHGFEVGPKPPGIVYAYVEITPFDTIKYELDKVTGYIRVDRPQRTSSQPPTLYGFVPRTYCGRRVGELSPNAKGGDHDPLDICVFSERAFNRSEVIVAAKVIGGLLGIDSGEADDKIIAVLENDNVWGNIENISELPENLVERLRHYFSTYKLIPGEKSQMTIEKVYDRKHALQVIEAAMQDYEEEYGS